MTTKMISEENNNVVCKKSMENLESQHRKTTMSHFPSNSSVGSTDLGTFVIEHQNERDFQNRSSISNLHIKLKMKEAGAFKYERCPPNDLTGSNDPCASLAASFAEKSPELVDNPRCDDCLWWMIGIFRSFQGSREGKQWRGCTVRTILYLISSLILGRIGKLKACPWFVTKSGAQLELSCTFSAFSVSRIHESRKAPSKYFLWI